MPWLDEEDGGQGEETIADRAETAPPFDLQLYSAWFCPYAQRVWCDTLPYATQLDQAALHSHVLRA